MSPPPGRLSRVAEALDRGGCDQLVAIGVDHTAHLTGYCPYLGSPAAVIVDRDGRRRLIVAAHELATAEDHAAAEQVIGYGSGDLLDLDPETALCRVCLDLCGASRTTAVAPGTHASAGGRLAARLTSALDFEATLKDIRLVKDADELERIARASRLCLDAQAAVAEAIAADPPASEIALFSAAQTAAQTRLGAPVQFICTIAADARAALIGPPAATPGPAAARDGEGVLADIAVRAGGYWGDSARTHRLARNRSLACAYETLEEIKAAAAALLTPGRPACDVYRFVGERLAAAFDGFVLPHHAGHGLGIDVGEAPQLVPDERRRLEQGMVVALEPSVYRPGEWGARAEDVFVVTADGGRPVLDWLHGVPPV